MRNDEKIDIKLSDGIPSEDLSQDENFQRNYDTVLRYINIAEHMNQFEDQDKYYQRAIDYLKKINEDGRFADWMEELNCLKFGTRAEGKVTLYEEASRIRDNAKSVQDYYSAQILFLRIAKYEEKHPIVKKWVKNETIYNKSLNCMDSKEQAQKCEDLAIAMENSERRKSLFASIVIIILIFAALVYSRTSSCRLVLANVYNLMGDYTSSYQKYNAVYERSGKTDQSAYDHYLEARYKAALKGMDNCENFEATYADLKAVANDDYKDSRQKLFDFEKQQLKDSTLSGMVLFADMHWRVLDKTDDSILIIKDRAMSKIPFNETPGPCTWETSSVRTFLNDTFLEEHFFDIEKDALLDSTVVASPNTYYAGANVGNDTTDKVFLLSVDEAEKYIDQLHRTETCWWLRTTGAVDGSAAFVYFNKHVMPYGCNVDNIEITVKPAIWVSLK